MEAILNELGLGILKETFEAERVEPEVVACLSDGNLASLGEIIRKVTMTLVMKTRIKISIESKLLVCFIFAA